MSRFKNNGQFPPKVAIIVGVLVVIGLGVAGATGRQQPILTIFLGVTDTALRATNERQATPAAQIGELAGDRSSPSPPPTATPTPTASATPTSTPTATQTSTPTMTPTATPTPTPTLDLSVCNAAGCDPEAEVLPTAVYNPDLLLEFEAHLRRECEDCPPNPVLSEEELIDLLTISPDMLVKLEKIALSQETYEVAPGIVYIVFENVHHVVIDLEEPDYILRNVIPATDERGTLITPSYCYTPDSLVVIDAGLSRLKRQQQNRNRTSALLSPWPSRPF